MGRGGVDLRLELQPCQETLAAPRAMPRMTRPYRKQPNDQTSLSGLGSRHPNNTSGAVYSFGRASFPILNKVSMVHSSRRDLLVIELLKSVPRLRFGLIEAPGGAHINEIGLRYLLIIILRMVIRNILPLCRLPRSQNLIQQLVIPALPSKPKSPASPL